jgi:iron(III) transport system substrate-binding protein
MNRRDFLKVLGGALAASAALAACGGASAPTTAIASGKASASGASGVTASTWEDLLAAAKLEGKVVVTGSPDTEVRQKLPAAFKQRFGIDMEYLAGATEVTSRLQSERSAGVYTLDAQLGGTDSIYGTLLANGWLDPIKLLSPEATDGSKWKTGAPWFRDPDGDKALQIINILSPSVVLNTDIVKPGDVTTADSLLDPKWKGKICAFDPGVNGGGLPVASVLYLNKGEDWVTKFYKGQNVVLSRDYKQLADWVAHGAYPIGLAVGNNYLTEYAKEGVHFQQIQLPDAPPSSGGAFGIVVVINRAPHPNAAQVFANWMASKEGQTIYAQAQLQVAVRNDIDSTWAPPDSIPKPGVQYLDTYDYTFATKQRLQIRDFYARMLR